MACAVVFPPVYPWTHRTSASCAEWETRATRRTAGNRPPFEGFNKERVGVHANLGYPRARVHRQFRSLCHRPLDPSNLGPLDPWILGHLVAFDQGRAYMVMPWWNFLNPMNTSQVHPTWWIISTSNEHGFRPFEKESLAPACSGNKKKHELAGKYALLCTPCRGTPARVLQVKCTRVHNMPPDPRKRGSTLQACLRCHVQA